MSANSPSPTVVVTDTDRLSAVADAILARADNPKLTKNTVLNLIAGTLAGSRTNWGGLKAMPSPVRATSLSDQDLAVSQVALLDDEEDEVLPYRIEETSLVFTFHHSLTGQTHMVAVSLTDTPAIMKAFFEQDSAGHYETPHLIITNWSHDQIVAETTFHDGTPGEICFNRAAFHEFLQQKRETILDILIEEDVVGQCLHSAFISVAEGQGEDLLFDAAAEYPTIEQQIHDEGAEANARRIDQACRNAVWAFLAGAHDHSERRSVIRRGPVHELVNTIIDHEWPLLGDVMRNAIEAEARE